MGTTTQRLMLALITFWLTVIQQIEGPYIDIVKNLFNNAKLPFIANRVNITHYKDKNDIIHVIYIIDTDISAMDNPVITIADMDLVLGKYIDWGAFIDSYSTINFELLAFMITTINWLSFLNTISKHFNLYRYPGYY